MPPTVTHTLRRARQRAITTLRPILPARARLVIRRADRAIDPAMVWLYRRRSGERRPIPPRGVRERNAVDNVDYWFTAADQATQPLLDLLDRAGLKLDDTERALDFGCGGGKVIAALRERGVRTELHGCDIHGPSIAWLENTFPDLHVRHTGFDPPLPYPDGHFDLLWAWSVLTHLDDDRQRAWMAEWARVLKPGGLLLATFNSPAQLRRRGLAEGRAVDRREAELQAHGIVFDQYDTSGNFAADFAGTTESYGDTFNTPERITELAADRFDVQEIAPDAVWGAQDCLIARRCP